MLENQSILGNSGFKNNNCSTRTTGTGSAPDTPGINNSNANRNRYPTMNSDRELTSTSATDSSSFYSSYHEDSKSLNKFKGHHSATAALSGPIHGSSFSGRSNIGLDNLKHVNNSRDFHYGGANVMRQQNAMGNMKMNSHMSNSHMSNSYISNTHVGNGSCNSSSSELMGKGKRGLWKNLLCRMDDSKYLGSKLLKSNKREIGLWLILTVVVFGGYKFFSDGSFSAVLTLASAFQCFSVALLNVKIIRQKATAGISFKTLYMIIISLLSRLISTVFYNGYLPVDRSGDWVYQFADTLTAVLIICLVCYSKFYLQSSVQQQQECDNLYVLIPGLACLVLALMIHPTLNQNFIADVTWTFALYLETLSMIPQLVMMGKLGGEIESLNSHFVASMAASKFFVFLFWFFSYKELAPRGGGSNIAGWAVLISYVLQLILYADFMYYYIKCIKIGRTMIINI